MKLVALIDRLNKAVAFLIGALLFFMVALTMWQVIVRFLLTKWGLSISAPWTEELSRYAMIWIVFLGSALACRKAQLISLDIFVHKMPRHLGVPIRYLVLAGSLVLFGTLFVLGMELVEIGQIETSPVLSISKSYVYLALPAGVTMMALNTIALVFHVNSKNMDIRFAGNSENLE